MLCQVLMCPPPYFSVRYEINPWMKVGAPPDHGLASTQWQRLVALYEQFGVEVLIVPPAPAQPDLVFTANAGLIYGQRFLLSRFRYPERRGEESYFRAWAQ